MALLFRKEKKIYTELERIMKNELYMIILNVESHGWTQPIDNIDCKAQHSHQEGIALCLWERHTLLWATLGETVTADCCQQQFIKKEQWVGAKEIVYWLRKP